MRRKAVSLVLISLILVACGAPSPTPEAPTPTPAPNVEFFPDLVYVEPLQEGVKPRELDVYKPLQPGEWPVVVLIHGLGGTKEGYVKESTAIAERGAVVFAADWPAYIGDIAAQKDGAGFREMYEVLACAVRYARSNASDYGGRPSRLILVGHSYGAVNGAWLALAGDNLDSLWAEYEAAHGGPPSQVKCVAGEGSINVDAFVGIAGGYDNLPNRLKEANLELWDILNLATHVGREPTLPIRLLHGKQDTTVDPESSVELNALLAGAGYDTSLILFDGTHRVPSGLTADVVMDLAGK
jgi:predicted esterase